MELYNTVTWKKIRTVRCKRRHASDQSIAKMAEKFYSTLTSDLGNHYRIEMAKRLTRSAPKHAGSMNFTELKVMSRKDSVETLSKLLGLRREEIFRREQEEALALAGFRKESKQIKFLKKKKEEAAIRQAEKYLKKKQRETLAAVGPRYYDPEARTSANSLGPAGYDVFTLPKSMRKVTGGSSFGRSTTQRGGFLGNQYRDAQREAERQRKEEEERVLNGGASLDDSRHGGSRIIEGEVRRHMRNSSSASGALGSSMYGSIGHKSIRRGQQISAMGSRQYMISSGPRSNPTAPASLSGHGLSAAPTRSSSKWSGPGPRYNVRERLLGADGRVRGKGAKFSKGARPDINKKTSGPDVMYKPSFSVVDKNRPNTTMCPRREVGSFSAVGSEGPGPAYYPGYDNKGHMGTSKSFSFDNIENRGREKVKRRQLGIPDELAPSIERRRRQVGMKKRAKSTGTMHGRRQAGRRTRKPQKMNMTLQETRELFAEAQITEMRKGIWQKIRGRGDGAKRASSDLLSDSLDTYAKHG